MNAHRKRQLFPGAIAIMLLFLLTGCFGSNSKSLSTGSLAIYSQPSGADIFLNGKPQGHKTPHTFKSLEPGNYIIRLSLAGYPDKELQEIVQAGKTREILVPMDGEAVTGYVTNGPGGPPVSGSKVEAFRAGENTVVSSTRTHDDGSFTLHVPPGRYDFIASQPETDTWAVGIFQDVEVPTTKPIEIMQRQLFADSATADPQKLSISVSGLKPGAIVSGPTPLNVDVTGSNSSLIRQIAIRVGHHDWHTDASLANQQTLSWILNPSNYGPGETFLHVRAYDIQLNAAELIIPFTIPAGASGPKPPDAPEGLELAAFTFVYSANLLSLEPMDTLVDYVIDGMSIANLPDTSRWVRLVWDRDPNAAGYKVYRRTEHENDLTLVADWSAARPRSIVAGRERYVLFDTSAALQAGTSYYYTVRAYNEAGELGPPTDEVEVFVLEPFEARLTEPKHHARVRFQPTPVFRWEGTRLPERSGFTYDYVYRFSVATETSGGLQDPNSARSIDRINLEAATCPHLLPGQSYQWDLTVAFAMVDISPVSQAFSVSGKMGPNDLLPQADGALPDLGGSTNGAFRFEVEAP